MEGTGSTILAVGGGKATYLFSLWHLSWLASQSIYYISIIQATGVQLTCNNMEFNEVLGFLFIFQKILYLEKQRNRDLFQCRLHLKKKSWWMLFWSLLLLHSEITPWNCFPYCYRKWSCCLQQTCVCRWRKRNHTRDTNILCWTSLFYTYLHDRVKLERDGTSSILR